MTLTSRNKGHQFTSRMGPDATANAAHSRRNPTFFRLWLVFLSFLSAFPLRAADPVLNFYTGASFTHESDERIRVKNVSVSSDILFFGDSWVRKNSVSGLMHTLEIRLSNRLGRANLRNIDLVEKAIWCAVDLKNGDHVFGSVTSYAGTELEISQFQLLQAPKSLSFNCRRLDLLIVRPGEFAWTARVSDGGPNDGGPFQDEQVQVAFETMEQAWSQGSAIGFFDGPQSGDLILGINPEDMTYFAFQFGVSN